MRTRGSRSVGNSRNTALLVGMILAASSGSAGEFDRWRYWQAITLDTTPVGADVRGDVLAYPLAVVLGPNEFDFSRAKPDGSDIRFSRTSEGGALVHSIEHWDRDARSAVLWVKLDAVEGARRSKVLVMHWGNPQAADASDSRAVFAAREGFVGVFHLAEGGGTQRGGYRDSTVHEAHATGVNLSPGSRVAGRVGWGLGLRHTERQWVKIDDDARKLFDLTTRATISIWALARGYFNRGLEGKALPGYETMFAKGDASWRIQKFGVRGWHKPPAELVEMCVEQNSPKEDRCVVGKTDLATEAWFHLVAVHDYPKARLYVNGALDAEESFEVNWVSGDYPVGIGNQSQFPEQGRFWDGVLDEARVLNVPKDEHWIKLDYESQREGSKLLTFGPIETR